MSRLAGLRAVVVGAGAVGSTVAFVLQSWGADVTLVDPAALGDNASGVAAGMLAPAFEAVLDPASAGHYPLLKAARDAWPALAEAAGLEPLLDRSGALLVDAEGAQEAMQARLSAVGAAVERLSLAEAAGLSPGLNAPDGAILAPDDWRIEPLEALRRLRTAFVARGGRSRAASVTAISPDEAVLADGERLAADAVILCTGLAPNGVAEVPGVLARLEPIKGQIARFEGAGPTGGPAVRAPGVYVSPHPLGPAVGATMEAGRTDRAVEPETLVRMAGLAGGLFPALASARVSGAAGVRAGTPDGLPLAGRAGEGPWLALGARRNGWLLAPMMAQVLADLLAGDDAGPFAAGFDPNRFG